MTFLVYRLDEKTGKKYGPYAVKSVRVQGCETPRQVYLGRALILENDVVVLKKTGETLGKLGEKIDDKIRVDDI